MSLRGKVAVVSGAAQGLGREIARALAVAGCHVAVCDVVAPDARWSSALARETGVTVAGVKVDVSDARALEAWLESVKARFGSVDVAVANAGVLRYTDPLGSVDSALVDYAHHIDVNARAAYVMGRSVLPDMIARREGTIALVSSAAVRPPDGECSGSARTDLHDASRWALNGLISRWADAGAASGVRTIGLSLGDCDTAARRELDSGSGAASVARAKWLDPVVVADVVVALVDGGPDAPSGANLALWQDPVRMSLPRGAGEAAYGPLGTMRAAGSDLPGRCTGGAAGTEATLPLVGRRALVSGAAAALGEAIARALVQAGADVVLCDHDPSVLAVGEGIEFESDRRVLGMVGNVSKPDDVERLVQAVARELGGLDLVVNAASVCTPSPLDVAVSDAAATFDQVFADTVLAALMLQRTATPYLVAAGGGDIINVTTTEVLSGGLESASVDDDAIGAANWAINGFTQAWARALGPSCIRVNAVAVPERVPDNLDDPAAAGDVVVALVAEQQGRTGETIATNAETARTLPPPCRRGEPIQREPL